MAERAEDFGPVDLVQADAVGVPGSRRFRLRARAGADFALIWVEREQIQALALALEQLLAQVQLQRQERPVAADAGAILDDFPPTPRFEFTAGQMGLGYDEDGDLAVLELKDIQANLEDDDDEEARPEPAPPDDSPDVLTLTLRFRRAQAAALKEQCETTLKAGRPRCHLCGAPMAPDGSHFCIRANGHAPSSQN
jgi:uncharacterized repeat protein (TIGR03847 family)